MIKNAKETNSQVVNILGKVEALYQTNVLRNAWATWAVEDMLQKKKGIVDSKPKNIFGRGLTVIRIRSSKSKVPKKPAPIQFDTSPLSVITAEMQVDSSVNPFSEVNSDDADVFDDIPVIQGDEISLQTDNPSKQASSSNKEGSNPQVPHDSKAGENAKNRRIGISGALRSKLKQRSDKKIQKKADKCVYKAMARAELERKNWLKKVKQEEEEEAAAATERKKAFMAKAASRSKNLMLQHLCAISIQSSWRSACARAQLKESKELSSELQVSRLTLFDDDDLSSEQESNPETNRTEDLKVMVEIDEHTSLTQENHGPASP